MDPTYRQSPPRSVTVVESQRNYSRAIIAGAVGGGLVPLIAMLGVQSVPVWAGVVVLLALLAWLGVFLLRIEIDPEQNELRWYGLYGGKFALGRDSCALSSVEDALLVVERVELGEDGNFDVHGVYLQLNDGSWRRLIGQELTYATELKELASKLRSALGTGAGRPLKIRAKGV